jgi:hypothetical protein
MIARIIDSRIDLVEDTTSNSHVLDKAVEYGAESRIWCCSWYSSEYGRDGTTDLALG